MDGDTEISDYKYNFDYLKLRVLQKFCLVIKQLRTELNTLEEERKKHMAVFIQDAADKLQQIWAKCHVSEYTKELFMAELDTTIDEDSQLSFYQENIEEWTQY